MKIRHHLKPICNGGKNLNPLKTKSKRRLHLTKEKNLPKTQISSGPYGLTTPSARKKLELELSSLSLRVKDTMQLIIYNYFAPTMW